MKIVIDEDIPFIRNVFEPYAEVVYLAGSKFTQQLVRDADALIIRTRTFCNETLLAGTSVRLIATATIGYDHVDTLWCADQGIAWRNAAGCNAGAVAQYVICAILEIAQRKRMTLAGKTLGIVGVGHVGSKLKEQAAALSLNVLCCDPPRAETEGLNSFVDLDYLAAHSDIVSFHVPLNYNDPYPSYHLASARFFDQLKPGAIFINSSRGEVTDESALLAAIENKRIGASVLDVWENEPNIDTKLLTKVDLASPHIAGYSAQGKANATSMAVQHVATALNLPLTNWLVRLDPPVPSEIRISHKNNDLQTILHDVMNQTYSITSDDANLRVCSDKFEQLRKNYHYRHQPISYSLQINDLPKDLNKKLKLLGFAVE